MARPVCISGHFKTKINFIERRCLGLNDGAQKENIPTYTQYHEAT